MARLAKAKQKWDFLGR